MNSEKISGIGSIHQGEYEIIEIDGIGKLKGNVSAAKLVVSGKLKSKGKITADELLINGLAGIFQSIKVKKMYNNGTLKLRRAVMDAEEIESNGILVSNREISADRIMIHGYCSVKSIFGDRIKVDYDFSTSVSFARKIQWLVTLYLGRHVNSKYCLIDRLECTDLNACGLKAKLVRAGRVKLENCVIDRLYCDEEPKYDSSCRIKRLYIKDGDTFQIRKGDKGMGNITVEKILKLYKNDKINEEEAELMLKSVLFGNSEQKEAFVPSVHSEAFHLGGGEKE